VLDTTGLGWQVGTIILSGSYNGEIDYNVHYTAKWADYGVYTVRYEGETKEYYHPAADSPNPPPTKPDEARCNAMGIPFGADGTSGVAPNCM